VYQVTESDVARARRLACVFAARSGVWRMLDDWESAALLGLARAARDFDPARGYRFWTYAHPLVVGSIQDEARSTLPVGFRRIECPEDAPVVLSIDAPIDDGALIRDLLLADDEPADWMAEYQDEVESLARQCIPSVARVVMAHYLTAGQGQRETGRRLGLSGSRVSQCLATARSVAARSISA
jgi:RNA polymerase sigma factor (sigma-70 family)